MRTIFISPLLWQRLNRAVRRREEGQALVIIAAAAIALVAIVGLSVDGGMSYWEAQRLQRAADQAALAGVVWMPNKRDVADYRGRNATFGQGYNIYQTQSGTGVQLPFTKNEVLTDSPGQKTYYESQNPVPPSPTMYRVSLTTKVPRYFMGVLGFKEYTITRSATADYATPARLGGSFNYFGSSSLTYDWLIPTKKNENDPYYTTLYNRYFAKNCQRDGANFSATDPCVGTFWVSMQGLHAFHTNGDAYSPIGMGADTLTNDGAFGGVRVPNKANYDLTACPSVPDPATWFLTLSGGGCDPYAKNGNLPLYNLDTHPDSNGERGFGYEIAVEVDEKALIGGGIDPGTSDTKGNTRLNVYLYDAAQAEKNDQNFNTGDAYYNPGGATGWAQRTPIISAIKWKNGDAYAKPTNTTADPSNCPINPSSAIQIIVDCAKIQDLYQLNQQGNAGDFTAGGSRQIYAPATNNGAMIRYSLYAPPAAKGIATTFQTKGDLIGSFITTDASFKSGNTGASNQSPSFPNTTSNPSSYTKDWSYAPGSNERDSYCYIAYPDITPSNLVVTYAPTGERSPLASTSLTYTCPNANHTYATGVTDIDYWYWLAMVRGGFTGSTYAIASDPTANNPSAADVAKGTPVNEATAFETLDPVQFCRGYFDPRAYNTRADWDAGNSNIGGTARKAPIAQDAGPGGTDKKVNRRIPFNMRGLETNAKAWNNNANVIAMPYRGWACAWDFDSSNKALMNVGQNPGTYDDQNEARVNVDGIVAEPFFHLSNWGYLGDGSGKQRINYQNGVKKAGAGGGLTVRGGVYLLHVQNFGFDGSNRYAVKVEYENPLPVSYTFTDTNGNTFSVPTTPVPQVYGIGAMGIYTNSNNTSGGVLNVIFDLAYIPRQNAGTTAILELWDPGDVATGLDIQILEPTGFGLNLDAGKVAVGNALKFTPTVCPMYKGSDLCVFGPSSTSITAKTTGGFQYFNGQWLLLAFQVPDISRFDTVYDPRCNTNQVPTQLCYYFQVNYKMTSGGVATDNTTWSLQIANQPVRLVQ